jgi:hypothetical protein
MKLKFWMISLLLIITLAFPLSTFANAAEPPIIIILIPDVGLDVKATIESEEAQLHGEVREKKFETYVRFYRHELQENESLSKNVVFVFDTNKGEIIIEHQFQSMSYNQLYTLDIKNKTLIKGKSLTRDLSLIGMRFGLTLLIEGSVFFLMAYKQARTWILLFVVNLLTQGSLNYSITMSWIDNGYILFGFVIMELLILVIEWIALLLLVKEGKKIKLWLTITLANILSLFLGGYLILNFPL